MTDGFQSVYPSGFATVSNDAASREADVGTSDALQGSGPGDLGSRRPPAIDTEPALPRWLDARAELPALRAQ